MAYNASYPSSGTVKYSPVIYSRKVMKLFTESTLLNEITNNDYTGEIKGKGDTVQVRVAPTKMTVGDYVVGTDISYETPSDNARSLTIDQAKYVAFDIDDVDEVQSDLALMTMFADRAQNSLDINTSTAVLSTMGAGAYDDTANGWGTWTSGNIGLTAGKISGSYNLGVAGTPLQVTSTNAFQKILDLGSVLDEADVPQEGLFVVLPAWYCNMLKAGDLKRADVTGDSTGTIRTGLIGMVDNFMVYRSNLIKHVTDTAPDADCDVFSVVAGVKDACTFAAQVTKTETCPVEFGFGEHWKTLLLYGLKVIQPEALASFYCTADDATITP